MTTVTTVATAVVAAAVVVVVTEIVTVTATVIETETETGKGIADDRGPLNEESDGEMQTQTHTHPVETTGTGSVKIATLDATGAEKETGIETAALVETTAAVMKIDSTGVTGTRWTTADVEGGTGATRPCLGMRAVALHHRLPKRENPHLT